jgi:hypothetical protein
MTGRYSWLIHKPSFLLGSKEKYYVNKAKECLIEHGLSEKDLSKPRVRDAVIVYFDDRSRPLRPEVVLDKTSGEQIRSSW